MSSYQVLPPTHFNVSHQTSVSSKWTPEATGGSCSLQLRLKSPNSICGFSAVWLLFGGFDCLPLLERLSLCSSETLDTNVIRLGNDAACLHPGSANDKCN